MATGKDTSSVPDDPTGTRDPGLIRLVRAVTVLILLLLGLVLGFSVWMARA